MALDTLLRSENSMGQGKGMVFEHQEKDAPVWRFIAKICISIRIQPAKTCEFWGTKVGSIYFYRLRNNPGHRVVTVGCTTDFPINHTGLSTPGEPARGRTGRWQMGAVTREMSCGRQEEKGRNEKEGGREASHH
jgi:hypothetical protein